MALAESQCYTIINTPELSDIYNEMKLKKDLGKLSLHQHAYTGYSEIIDVIVVAQNKAMKMFKSKR